MNDAQKKLIAILKQQLFNGEKVNIKSDEIESVLTEAEAQAVFTVVFPCLQKDLKGSNPDVYAQMRQDYLGEIYANTSNFAEHAELHRLMTEKHIPYVVLKGFSSAYYYPDPALRNMGDVDFLVYEKDFDRAKEAIEGIGFCPDEDKEDEIHITFRREPLSVWEQHREINGVPDGKAGKLVRAELEDVIIEACLAGIDGEECLITIQYHHGLIMLLHMAKHLTSEGIGLRHICDWAVFADRFDNEQFENEFKAQLKKLGLWKFAQIMTLICIKYLGARDKECVHNDEISDELLEAMLSDMLNGGNFGIKDANRYREIKYISSGSADAVEKGSIYSQLFKSLNTKVYANHKFIEKHRVFLPAGWAAEGVKYASMLISGKRKNAQTTAMLKEAAKRKDIYSQAELFKTER